jgi:cytochrome c oxidase assembly protein Cox11
MGCFRYVSVNTLHKEEEKEEEEVVVVLVVVLIMMIMIAFITIPITNHVTI